MKSNAIEDGSMEGEEVWIKGKRLQRYLRHWGVVIVGIVLFLLVLGIYHKRGEYIEYQRSVRTHQESQEKLRDGIVVVNDTGKTAEDMGIRVGILDAKYEEDNGEKAYYFIVEDKVYEVDEDVYKAFDKGSKIQFKDDSLLE